MNMNEAMSARHTVRKFDKKPLSTEIVEKLNERIEENNVKHGLSMSLVTNNTDALPGVLKLALGNSSKNYIVLAGPDTQDAEEKLGYASSDLMLYAQTIGLNTWWIGGTLSRSGVAKNTKISDDDKIIGIVVVGVGTNQGKPHKSKTAEDIATYLDENGKELALEDAPHWFNSGVQAVLLAPTAVNRQGFSIVGEGNRVVMSYKQGPFGRADLGIGKHHFELGAGVENFEWR